MIDTNVMLHAENAQEPRQEESIRLLTLLRECQTRLCIDEGFELDESRNRSHIGAEYLRHLTFGMLGSAIIAHSAASQRIKIVPRRVPQAVSKRIRTNVLSPPDRAYVCVAFNSIEKFLVSHDYGDIPERSRDRLRQDLGVSVVEAVVAVPQMS